MEDFYDTDDDLIAAYLLDQLQPDKREAFEARLATDSALREAVELERMLMGGVRYAARLEVLDDAKRIRKNLERRTAGKGWQFRWPPVLGPRLSWSRRQFWQAAAMFFLAGFGFGWFLFRSPLTDESFVGKSRPRPLKQMAARKTAWVSPEALPETPAKDSVWVVVYDSKSSVPEFQFDGVLLQIFEPSRRDFSRDDFLLLFLRESTPEQSFLRWNRDFFSIELTPGDTRLPLVPVRDSSLLIRFRR